MSASRLLRVCTPGCARDRFLVLAGLLLTVAGSAAACAEGGGPTTHQVTIRNFQYVPATTTLAVGDTIVWINEDVVPHTATATDRAWDTGSVGSRESGRVAIGKGGTHSYVCALHPNMRAELTVE